MKEIKTIVFLSLFCLVGTTTFGQKTLSGEAIFRFVEDKYQVSFNYLPAEVASFEVPNSVFENKKTLREILQFIKFHTHANLIEYKTGFYNVAPNEFDYCLVFTNSFSGEAIGDFEIIINQQIKVTTNPVGKVFLSDLNEIQKLEIVSKNYQLENVEQEFIREQECQSIYIIPNEFLDEVLIVDYLAKGIILKNNQGISITPKEFGTLPGLINPDVFHSLQYIPGVLSPTESISEINTRGGTHDQNLILWNGARMYQTGHFFGMISALNPFSLHEVSVYKNGTSAQYGEGVSSVMDIQSFAEFDDENSTTLHSNLLSGSFATSQQVNSKFRIQAAARFSYTNFFNSPTYKKFSERVFQNTEAAANNPNSLVTSNQNFFFRDASVLVQYQPDKKNHFKLGLLAFENELDFDEVATSNASQAANLLSQENLLGVASWKHLWNRKQSTSIDFTGSYYNLFARNASPISIQVLEQENEIMDFGIQLKHQLKLSANLDILFGYHFQEIGVMNTNIVNQPNIQVIDKNVLRIQSIFAETNFSISERFKGNLGVRSNYYSRINQLVLEPRLNFNFKLTPFANLVALGQLKHQSLSQVIDQQEDFFGIEKRRWTLNNNNNFNLAESRQIELGWNYNKQNWLLQTNLYYKTVTRLNSRSQGFQNQLENLNILGDYTTIGWEVLAQKKWENWRIWSNFALTKNDYEFTEFTPSIFPNNFELSFSNSSGISFTKNGYALALGSRFHTGKPITNINENTPIVDPEINPNINFLSPNQANLPVYFQLNISASKKIELDKKQLQMGLSIMNLLNQEIELNKFYQLNEDATQVNSFALNNLGFTPNFFVSFQF